MSETRFTAHPDLLELQALMPYVRKFQAIASKHGIDDIFQDNGGKVLQLALTLGIQTNLARMGNDATDALGQEYELKTVNARKTSSFSTHHHLNPVILAKYRKVSWIFAVYIGIELQSIYLVRPPDLESYFLHWETKLKTEFKDHINNPKISINHVRAVGELLYQIPAETIQPILPFDSKDSDTRE